MKSFKIKLLLPVLLCVASIQADFEKEFEEQIAWVLYAGADNVNLPPINITNLKKFINLGGDINKKYTKNNTLLILTVLMKNAEMLKILIEAKADVDAQNSAGQTALFWAKALGYNNIAELLKKASAKE